MLMYLKQAWGERIDNGQHSEADLLAAIREGAVLRVRPKAMTVAVIIADYMGKRHRQRSNEPDSGADARRHDHRTAAVNVGHTGSLSINAL